MNKIIQYGDRESAWRGWTVEREAICRRHRDERGHRDWRQIDANSYLCGFVDGTDDGMRRAMRLVLARLYPSGAPPELNSDGA